MECKKIFSYTKKILKLSFLSFILSISFSNKGVFAALEYSQALPVESKSTFSDGIAEYVYPDTSEDQVRSTSYSIENGKVTANVHGTGAVVFSRIAISDDQSGSSAAKEFKVSEIVINSKVDSDYNVDVYVLNKDDKIEIVKPEGTKNLKVTAYLPVGTKPDVVFGVKDSEYEILGNGIVEHRLQYDKYSLSVNSVAQPEENTDSESLSSDEESNSEEKNKSDEESTSSKSSSSKSNGSSSSSSTSNYSSSNYNSGSSSSSGSSASSSKSTTSSSTKSSSSGSASKSASTKTFDSSFNPLFLLSGVCIPLFKKKKD